MDHRKSQGPFQLFLSLLTMATLKARLVIKPMIFFQSWVPIFHKLINFIIGTLEAQAFKSVILGCPPPRSEPNRRILRPEVANDASSGVSDTEGVSRVRIITGASNVQQPLQGSSNVLIHHGASDDQKKRTGPCGSTEEEENESERAEKAAPEQQDKVPKKIVSFSETTEVMDTSIGKRKRRTQKQKAPFKKMPSMEATSNDELNDQKIKELKPLRSILKVGSNVGETFASS